MGCFESTERSSPKGDSLFFGIKIEENKKKEMVEAAKVAGALVAAGVVAWGVSRLFSSGSSGNKKVMKAPGIKGQPLQNTLDSILHHEITGSIELIFVLIMLFMAAPALAVTGILVYIGSFSIGMGFVPWVVMSEIFDINIKGAGGSLATLINWFGSWAVSYTYNFLISWSSYVTYILYAAINALAIIQSALNSS
ncbi:sugar transporter ERD6-like 7 [Heracleum sosnowskyi]|uniref:Sugar transporter ERD6-like 7 n=1 Tax=Heracleum sosnowskyi TaxID=360622 RepID=A0AAD8I973_9APIA|nr:sugar transporter ERD6-like 7 [Heracleum sosnowskyi]